MGYETKLLVGESYTDDWYKDEETGAIWIGRPIATYALSNPGYTTHTGHLLAECRKVCKAGDAPRYWYYADDGNTHVVADHYDAPLSAIPLNKLITAMNKDNRTDFYRRFFGASLLLQTFTGRDWQNPVKPLVVIQYGY